MIGSKSTYTDFNFNPFESCGIFHPESKFTFWEPLLSCVCGGGLPFETSNLVGLYQPVSCVSPVKTCLLGCFYKDMFPVASRADMEDRSLKVSFLYEAPLLLPSYRLYDLSLFPGERSDLKI